MLAVANEMSHRRKHVTSNAKDWCPAIKDNQKVLRVAALRGSNLVEASAVNFVEIPFTAEFRQPRSPKLCLILVISYNE